MKKKLLWSVISCCVAGAGAAPQRSAMVAAPGASVRVEVALHPLNVAKAQFLGIQLENMDASASVPEMKMPLAGRFDEGSIRQGVPIVSMAFEAPRERLPTFAAEMIDLSNGAIVRWNSLSDEAQGARVEYTLDWHEQGSWTRNIADSYRHLRGRGPKRSISAAISKILTSLQENGLPGVRLEYSNFLPGNAYSGDAGVVHSVRVTFDAPEESVPHGLAVINDAADEALKGQGTRSWKVASPDSPLPLLPKPAPPPNMDL